MTERINPDGLVLSQDYAATMEEDVLPWLRARMQKLSFPGQGGKAIAAWRFDAVQHIAGRPRDYKTHEIQRADPQPAAARL